MAKYSRWKSLMLITAIIGHSSGIPKSAANVSTDTSVDYNLEENAGNIPTAIIQDYHHEDNETDISTEMLYNYNQQAKAPETMCDENEFECHDASGKCIRESWRCDGENDCSDGSDEKNCFSNRQTGPACGFGNFACQDDSGRCIRASWRCDGEDDCRDASDEKNCYSNILTRVQCPSQEFMCQDGSGTCIRGSWRCDGEYDCMDGSDEKNCFTSKFNCPIGDFMCLDGSSRCIRGSWRCDGSEDCMDGSDEKNCFATESIKEQNISKTLQDIESDFPTFEEVRNIAEVLTSYQEDDRSRFFFGCTTEMRQKLSECKGKCTSIICMFKEIQGYLSACRTGNTQTCSIVKCKNCGIANTASARRLGKSPKRERPSTPIRQGTKEPTRIIGGEEVDPPRKYPWQVGLISSGTNNCGGSIINSRWILTAAHCLVDTQSSCTPYPFTNDYQVRVGEHSISSLSDNDPANTRDYDIKRYVIHPDIECPGFDNDFALIELTKEIPFNDVIRPVCLPADDSKTYAGVKATISGWGLRDDFSLSDVLMEADVTIDAQSDCIGHGVVPDTQMCAGPTDGKDTCFGDSGGPLVVKEGDKYVQVGVVSLRGWNCGSTTTSAVHSRVSKVLAWISDTIASGKC